MKESAGHRRGRRGSRKSAAHPTEAACEAGKRAVESRPAGQRPPVGKMRMVAAPGSGSEAGMRAKERHFGRERPSSGSAVAVWSTPRWGSGLGERQARHESRAAVGRHRGEPAGAGRGGQ